MTVADRSTKRVKGDGPSGGSEGYYGQPPPLPGGRYLPYSGPGGPPMGPQSSYMWQQGHPPPPHSWGHGSPTTGGSIYTQRGGPSMTPDRPGYASAYTRAPPPPIQGPGGVHRGAKSSGPPPRQSGKSLDKPPKASSGPSDVPSHQPGYQGSYYPPPQAPYGSSSYPSSGPPPMHHPPTSYGNPPPPPALYGSSPPRPSQTRNRASPELMGANSPGPIFCQPAESPDLEGIFSRGVGPLDDDGNGSTGGGGNSKDKGRGSYKCGRCGVPKKGHVCPYQPKLTRRPGEPLPDMRSAAIQVEMDEFMTLRRLNLRIQGFPESYASEPYGDDMVVGEPHAHPPMTVNSTSVATHGDMMSVGGDNDPAPPLSSHDQVVGVLSSPIRTSPMTDDPISAT